MQISIFELITMELVIVITTLCVSLSVMLTPCASQQILAQSSHDHHAQGLQVIPVHTLPRKLGLVEETATVKLNGGKELSSPYNKLKVSLSGKQHREAAGLVHARGGTRQEWAEATNSDKEASQFFTMDYSQVRRRRPIHNKSVPAGP